jgi:hypothetical protein
MGCTHLGDGKRRLELNNGVIDGTSNVIQRFGEMWPLKSNILHDYIDIKVALQINLEARNALGDPKLCNCAFVIEKVAAATFDVFELYVRSKRKGAAKLASPCREKCQPSVSIFAGAVMQKFQQAAGLPQNFVGAFISKARLNAFDPLPQLLREWQEIVSVFLVFRGGIGNREIDTILMGYGISSYLSDSRESQTVQCGPELIKELAQFEGHVMDVRGSSFEFNYACPVGFALNKEAKRIAFDQRIPIICKRVSMQSCPPDTVPTFLKNA